MNALTPLTRDEAIAKTHQLNVLLTDIASHITQARTLLVELYQGEGYRIMGYKTWREWATACLNKSQATAYLQLEAALIGQPIGLLDAPTTHLKALEPLPPEHRQEAYTIAVETWRQANPDRPDDMITSWLKATVEVLQEAATNQGFVTLEDGETRAISAAIPMAAIERVLRQWQHIRDRKKPLLSEVYSTLGEAFEAMKALEDKPVRVVVYAVEIEK